MRRCFKIIVLFLFFAFLIIVTNWSWVKYFYKGFPYHWDPPFHAWKLKLVAENLLKGNILPPGYNSNCFYPYSMTLYYEALHWPQSVVAALFMIFTKNIVLIYNVVHLFFWAFSGVCFYLLLKELNLSEKLSIWGSAVFTILPYRISYLVEFNMQQCFGLILMFLFIVRFFKKPNLFNMLGFVLSFWLQSVSELYQTLIFVMAMPFFVLPLSFKFLGREFKRISFYINLLIALVIGGGICYYFLHPYYILHRDMEFSRGLFEIDKHSLEPFSYLLMPNKRTLIPFILTTHDELSVYPSIAVLTGFVIFLLYEGRIFRGKLKKDFFSFIRIIRFISFSLLFVFLLVAYYFPSLISERLYYGIFTSLFIIGFLSYFVLLFDKGCDVDKVFLKGLGLSAVFCFILSFGPVIHIARKALNFPNFVYLHLYYNLFLLSGMRVVSRFSIIVLIYLVIAACFGWNCVLRKIKGNVYQILFLLGLVISVLYESGKIHFKMRTINFPSKNKVCDLLQSLPPSPLLVIPFGNRWEDSLHMLEIYNTNHPLIYAWGGFYPNYQIRLVKSYKKGIESLLSMLQILYPAPLILIDKKNKFMPENELQYETKKLNELCEKLSENDRFSLFKVKSYSDYAKCYVRLIRTDFLLKAKKVSFSIFVKNNKKQASTILFYINGKLFYKKRINKAHCKIDIILNKHKLQNVAETFEPNRLGIAIDDNYLIKIDKFKIFFSDK